MKIDMLKLILLFSVLALILSTASLAISLVALSSLGGEERALPTITLEKFGIVGRGGRPVMRVWFSSDRWPVLVKLIGEERKITIDWLLVELPEDVPVTLYPPLQPQPYEASNAMNVVPGKYYLRFYTAPESSLERGELITSVEVEIRGPYLEFVKGKIFVDEFEEGTWYIYGVSFKANNTGDSPAYIDSVRIEVEGGASGWLHRDSVAVFSKTRVSAMSIIEDHGVIYLGPPGRYTVWIVVDLGFASWKYPVTVEVG